MTDTGYPTAGTLLSGRYRLDERIAAGGMGEVWRGTDEVLERPVAVKLLRRAHLGDESLASRFRAEARYAAALSHPGIARVFDYGESDRQSMHGAYLVMELVEGEPLSALIARSGRLSPGAALDIIGQSALALDAAHHAGIVHRDIKPGNLLITNDGRMKITDFGIARAVQASQAGHLTQTGMVMGTAQYVSPEQASGLPVSAASDIYSLGVVGYQCLAGRLPFIAETAIALALSHVREAPPPLPADVPTGVRHLIEQMMAKRPEQRPESGRQVAERARMLRDTLPVSVTAGLAGMAEAPPFTAEMPAEATRFAGNGTAGPDAYLGPGSQPADGATSQIAAGTSPWQQDGDDFPGSGRGGPRRPTRLAIMVAVAVLVLGIGGLLAALLLPGHHTRDTGSPPKRGRTAPIQSATTSVPPQTAAPAVPAGGEDNQGNSGHSPKRAHGHSHTNSAPPAQDNNPAPQPSSSKTQPSPPQPSSPPTSQAPQTSVGGAPARHG
jgi:eukaryotic-like serine/threonine-protein kinase